MRLHIDVFWMLLFCQLLHVEHLAVHVQVVKHVRVLVSSQPLVLPVKSNRLAAFKQLTLGIFVINFKGDIGARFRFVEQDVLLLRLGNGWLN